MESHKLKVSQSEPNDRTFEYWDKVSKGDIERTMNKICDGCNMESFKNKKDSIIFTLDIKFTKQDTVLDLACGIGRTCKWVAPSVKKYIGVDFIPKMIEEAKSYNKNYHNTSFVVNDGITLSGLDDNKIDVVYCELAFQHMLKPIQKSYIKEIFRVLKPNGSFYGQLPKLSFYKDDSFSLNNDEVTKLLKDFDVTWLSVDDERYKAYYIFKARKP